MRRVPQHNIKDHIVEKALQIGLQFALTGSAPPPGDQSHSGTGAAKPPQMIKKWSTLRPLVKSFVNRAHALQARATDPDLAVAMAEAEENDGDEVAQVDASSNENVHTIIGLVLRDKVLHEFSRETCLQGIQGREHRQMRRPN